jgi:hypothetical protein
MADSTVAVAFRASGSAEEMFDSALCRRGPRPGMNAAARETPKPAAGRAKPLILSGLMPFRMFLCLYAYGKT